MHDSHTVRYPQKTVASQSGLLGGGGISQPSLITLRSALATGALAGTAHAQTLHRHAMVLVAMAASEPPTVANGNIQCIVDDEHPATFYVDAADDCLRHAAALSVIIQKCSPIEVKILLSCEPLLGKFMLVAADATTCSIAT